MWETFDTSGRWRWDLGMSKSLLQICQEVVMMVSRYLLIEFDDETSATSLREQINKATRSGKLFRVVGLFARPGSSCQCAPTRGEKIKDRFTRGSKFGWWLCTTCNKPRLGDHQLTNILTPDQIIDPNTFEGVDYYIPQVRPRSYIRHAIGLSLITLPERIAKKKPN
jgi:hypothetical protein